MTEPTDHRAEAEDWTQDAKIHFIQAALRNDDGDLIGFDPKLMRGAKVAALIGIGHALLARGRAAPNEVPPDVAEAFRRRMEADQSEVRFPVDISDLTQP